MGQYVSRPASHFETSAIVNGWLSTWATAAHSRQFQKYLLQATFSAATHLVVLADQMVGFNIVVVSL